MQGLGVTVSMWGGGADRGGAPRRGAGEATKGFCHLPSRNSPVLQGRMGRCSQPGEITTRLMTNSEASLEANL